MLTETLQDQSLQRRFILSVERLLRRKGLDLRRLVLIQEEVDEVCQR